MEEQRHAQRLAVALGDHRLGRGPIAEHGVAQQVLGRDDLVGLALELGELAHEAHDGRDVVRGGEAEFGHAAASVCGAGAAVPRMAARHPAMISPAPATV